MCPPPAAAGVWDKSRAATRHGGFVGPKLKPYEEVKTPKPYGQSAISRAEHLQDTPWCTTLVMVAPASCIAPSTSTRRAAVRPKESCLGPLGAPLASRGQAAEGLIRCESGSHLQERACLELQRIRPDAAAHRLSRAMFADLLRVSSQGISKGCLSVTRSRPAWCRAGRRMWRLKMFTSFFPSRLSTILIVAIGPGFRCLLPSGTGAKPLGETFSWVTKPRTGRRFANAVGKAAWDARRCTCVVHN